MASRAEELRKLAARVTTAAGDTSAVSGTSISEILEFMKENLNVVDGALVVSDIAKPLVNLLKEPLTMPHYNDLGYALGLQANKTYKLEGYAGENKVPYSAMFETLDYVEAAISEGITDEQLLEGARGIVIAQDIKVSQTKFPELPLEYFKFDIIDHGYIDGNIDFGVFAEDSEIDIEVNVMGQELIDAQVVLTSITEVQ